MLLADTLNPISRAIYEQIGGYKSLFMMGSTVFSQCNGNGFGFNIKGCKTINYVEILLTHLDTYDVNFLKTTGLKYKTITEYKDVYCEDLPRMIEKETGLRLSLTKVYNK